MLRCSHVLCKVDDIGAAVRDYQELGFTVEWGSDPRRAHNALIWFAEGPFVELFELSRRAAHLRWLLAATYGAGAADRLVRWSLGGEGWRDVAVEADAAELSGTRSALRAAGVELCRPLRGRRTRPDGQTVRYQFAVPRSARLPFVVSAYDPPQRPAKVTHPNGAQAIVGVRFGLAHGDRPVLDALVGADRWLRPEPAATTEVRAVHVHGLAHELDPSRLHGAVLIPAP